MAKFVAPAVEDAALAKIATCTEMYFCNGQPVSRADAIARASGAVIPLTSADFTGPTTGAAGVRQLVVAAKSETATVNQNTDHVALTDGTTLLYVATASAASVSVGGSLADGTLTISVGPIS